MGRPVFANHQTECRSVQSHLLAGFPRAKAAAICTVTDHLTSPDWTEVDAHRAEHERLQRAAQHVARAVAELVHARAEVGDHASAVSIGEMIESLQLTQAQLAAAAERAFSLGQLAARRARHAAFRRQVDEATGSEESPSLT